MPSENQQTTQGYLLQVLINGGKAFRYRGGIRELLGLPDSTEAELSYPLPMPPAGFRYLQSLSHDKTKRGSPPGHLPQVKGRDLRNQHPPDAIRKEPMEVAVLEGPSIPASAKEPTSGLHPVVPTGSPGRVNAPGGKNMGQINDTVGIGKSERMQIDIPGFSEEARRFAALEPSHEQEKPTSNETVQPGAKQENTARTRAHAAHTVRTGPTGYTPPPAMPVREGATRKPRSPHAGPTVNEQIETTVQKSIPTLETAKPVAPPEIEILQGPARRSRRDIKASQVAEPAPVSGVPPRLGQQATEGRIEQLRHALETAKRQAIAEAAPPGDAENSRATRAFQSAGPAAQPVVIVKSAPAGRRSPAAFWERSYLGRLHRLRPLR
jgi:hypothetical protein